MMKKASPVFSVCQDRPETEDSSRTELSRWQEYQRTKDPALRQRLIMENIRLVYYAYGRMKARLPQGMEAEDAISYGMAGLIEAVDRYQVEKGRFSSLAYLRIQGAMYDGMLYFQWMNRHDQRLYQQWSRKQAEKTDPYARAFREEGPSEASYQGPSRILIPLEQAWEVAAEEERGPDFRLLEESDRLMLQRAIDSLEEREADIIRRYYYQGQSFRQIAAETGRSPSRVSELHKKSLQTMKRLLQKNEW